MKNSKKYIIILTFVIAMIVICTPISFGIVADNTIIAKTIVSRGVAILLSCLQVLEYVVPISFLVIKLFLNKKKHNKKNTLKNICLYLFISIFIFGLFFGIGELILKNTSSKIGYSSKTVDYINYNGKIVYFHR